MNEPPASGCCWVYFFFSFRALTPRHLGSRGPLSKNRHGVVDRYQKIQQYSSWIFSWFLFFSFSAPFLLLKIWQWHWPVASCFVSRSSAQPSPFIRSRGFFSQPVCCFSFFLTSLLSSQRNSPPIVARTPRLYVFFPAVCLLLSEMCLFLQTGILPVGGVIPCWVGKNGAEFLQSSRENPFFLSSSSISLKILFAHSKNKTWTVFSGFSS